MTAEILVFMLLLRSGLSKTASVDKRFESSRYHEIENTSNNVSTACQLRIDQTSQKKILTLIHHHQQKNAFELNVFIESSNDTLNRTRLLKGIKWANKMGRTLVSLIAEAENLPSMILSSYTVTLPEVDIVDIVMYEETKDCLLLSRKNTSDIVFSFLLHQLYLHSNADEPKYELCVRNTADSGKLMPNYNCCSLLGVKHIPICLDYSSTILVSFSSLLSGAIYLFVYIGFPAIVEQLDSAKKERLEFKVSDSPMSLSFIFYIIFIDGYGPVKSLGRRFVVAVIIYVTVLPEWDHDYLWSYILMGLWAILFVFNDVYGLNKEHEYSDVKVGSIASFLLFHKNLNAIIALPFNMKLFWNIVKELPFFHEHREINVVNRTINGHQSATSFPISERSGLLGQHELRQPNILRQVDRRLVAVQRYRLYVVVLSIIYLIALPFLCSICVSVLVVRYMFKIAKWSKCTLALFGYLTFLLALYSFMKCCALTFSLIAGIYLNAEYYSIYFVPLSIILFYSWSKWKSSVEEKYLELNTNIYKVCRDSIDAPQVSRSTTERDRGETSDHSSDNDNDNINGFNFIIKLDENKEPVIPKPLYDIVRENFVPYHDILVPYFQRVALIIVLSYFLYIFMSLAKTSGVSSNVQIISTMAASLLPFLFDVMWEKGSSRRQSANNAVLKSKIKHVLEVYGSNNDTGEIMVKFVGAIPTNPFGNQTF